MKKKKPQEPPQLGIFWLIRDRLVIESAPLIQAEAYGDDLTYGHSHIDVWKQLQLQKKVPVESEYDEYPRGRMVYHPRSSEFMLLADRCILEREGVVAKLKQALRLPEPVKLERDAHYRCWICLYDHGDEDDL